MKKLVLALAVAFLMAAPAFAAVQNVKVSGFVDSTYVNRQDFNFNQRFVGDHSRQSLFLTQTGLRVDADLSDNVSTTVGLINERVWGSISPIGTNTDAVDVYLAYVTMREFLYSPLTVTVGRQVFAFGNSLVFDATGPGGANGGALDNVANDLSMRSSLDAVRVTLDYKPLTIDIFMGKVAQGNVKGLGAQKDNTDAYGINANYQLGDAMNTVVEAYVFGKNTGKGALTAGSARTPSDHLFAPGLRASTNPVKGLNVQVEGALQRGNSNPTGTLNQKRDGLALQGMVSYALQCEKLAKYKPTVSASYTYVSGDKSATGDNNYKNSAWDPMFENQNGGTIFNSIFKLSNLQILNATVSANPIADVTTSLSWNGLWAAQKLTAGTEAGITTLGSSYLMQPDAATNTFTPQVTSNKELGNEFDANVSYAYTEDVKFGLNLGWFVPGRAFTAANDGVAKQAIASVGVNF
ncbi:MAG: alginate export family protein [Candidatus Omnitrophica bacterium]|nr:alginate export family protein [Candidatus Omnitrophota bacterium]